jgi:choice-of-anchor B domain-containing protein
MVKKFITAILIGCVSLVFAFESNNVRLVGQLPYEYTSDIWGYETPDGHDFALVGGYNGTYIVDISTNPAFPTETGFIEGFGSIWRDLKVHDHYVYVTNESGNGMDIIDVSDPWNPVLANRYYGFSSAHNLYIDDGYAYIVGSNLDEGGVRILDLSDPVNPVEVGSWEVAYVHDLYVKNNTMYVSALTAEKVFILDVTNKADIQQIAVVWNIPHCHAVWVSDDAATMFVASEMSNGYIRIFDIEDLSNINHISDFVVTPGDGQSVHNVFYLDDYLYLSYYVHGTRVVDVSDPYNPVEAGFYDPFPPDVGLYAGNWGVYPYSTSGLIYSTDSDGAGLSVLEFPLIADFIFDPLGDTEDLTNAIHIEVDIVEGINAELNYSTLSVYSGLDNMFSDITPMTSTQLDNRYEASLPNPGADGEFIYYVYIEDVDGNMHTQPFGAPGAYFSFHIGTDFEPPEILYVSHADNLGFMNTTGSYTVYGVAMDNIGVGTMSIKYSINNGDWQEASMDYNYSENNYDVYQGDMIWENLPIPSEISYYVQCWDSSSQQNSITSQMYFMTIGGYELLDNFENGLDKWYSDGDWGISNWGVDLSHAAHDSPDGSYDNNSSTSITYYQPFNLTPYSNAELRFYKASFIIPNQDFAYLMLSSDNEHWTTVESYTGWHSWMELEIVDISDWTGEGNENIYIRFQMTSDASNNADGFHVDNVEIFASVAPDIIPGDVNQDGILDVLDVVTIVSFVLGSMTPSEHQLIAGDYNNDGIIDVLDIVIIVGIIVGD